MARTNQKTSNEPFASGRSWEEPFGEFTVFVEESETDSGRYHTNFSQKAYVCRNGDPTRLHEQSTSSRSGHLLRKANTSREPDALTARDQVLAWLFECEPSAKTAYEAELLAATQAQERQQAQQLEELKVLFTARGPFAVLASQGVGFLSSADIATRLRKSTLAFNKLVAEAGFQSRGNNVWQACDSTHRHGTSQGQVLWSAIGVEAIWDWALAKELTAVSKEELLETLRGRFRQVDGLLQKVSSQA